jgi:hypothetical protein
VPWPWPWSAKVSRRVRRSHPSLPLRPAPFFLLPFSFSSPPCTLRAPTLLWFPSIPRYFRGGSKLAIPMNLSREYKFSFLALIFLLFLVPVDAVHGQPPHLRRSLVLKNGVHRRLGVSASVDGDLPPALEDLLKGPQSSSGESS